MVYQRKFHSDQGVSKVRYFAGLDYHQVCVMDLNGNIIGTNP